MAPFLEESQAGSALRFKVSYRGKLQELHREPSEMLAGLAHHLGEVTGANPDTIKLILPRSRRGVPGKPAPPALQPLSDEWRGLTLAEAGITQDMTILMSGASTTEVAAVSKTSAAGIADFEYEEKRARMRARRKRAPLALPTGPYVFADFRTLQLPGILLHPPETKALKLMHKLASDPGVVAIMNKYKWRVGIMTELAPEGYVGVSPVCLLGFNRNRGAEISLRLRTDDLAGFRKYDSIRKTLLHELTHMVHDDHDEHFKALNSLLNKQAEELDWTRKRAHTLGGKAATESDEDESESSDEEVGRVLGGGGQNTLVMDPRAAAAAAAMRRDAEKRRREAEGQPTADVADDVIMDDPSVGRSGLPSSPLVGGVSGTIVDVGRESSSEVEITEGTTGTGASRGAQEKGHIDEKDVKEGQQNDDSAREGAAEGVPTVERMQEEPSTGGGEQTSETGITEGASIGAAGSVSESGDIQLQKGDEVTPSRREPDPDDPDDTLLELRHDQDVAKKQAELTSQLNRMEEEETDGSEPMTVDAPLAAPAPGPSEQVPRGSDDAAAGGLEWQRAQEAAAEASGRVQKAVADLRQQAGPGEVTLTLKTLATILRNVMEHPAEAKYRRVRKTNAAFFERVGRFQAALEVLHAAGFREDGASDSMVLQRDDPGLLWLTCSFVEGSLA